MHYLAAQTGGVFFQGNEVDGNLAKALDEQSGYYLLSVSPDPSKLDISGADGRFHTIKVTSIRPGLKLRARQGFIGTP